MKKLFYFLSLGIISGMILMAGCGDGKDGDLTELQKQAQLLSGTWIQQTTSQLPDGVDPSILDALTLTFNADSNFNPSSFSSSGAPDFFSTSGTSSWAFSGSSTTSLILSGVTPVSDLTIVSLSANALTVRFTLSTGSLRVTSLEGEYTVELTK
jgi:hypothetical protein